MASEEDDEMKSKETKNSEEMGKQRTGGWGGGDCRVWRWPWWHRAKRMSHPHPNNERIRSSLTCRMEGMTESQEDGGGGGKVNAPSWPPQLHVYFWWFGGGGTVKNLPTADERFFISWKDGIYSYELIHCDSSVVTLGRVSVQIQSCFTTELWRVMESQLRGKRS